MGIEVTRDGPITTFTIANGTVNPITPAMWRELHGALLAFLADGEARVGILTGAGERAFSAGDDIKAESPSTGDAAADLLAAMGPGAATGVGTGPGAATGAGTGRDATAPVDPPGFDPADAVLRMERTKPVIGAVRGWCLGRGLFALLRLTDVRIATPDARFGLPEIAYGMGGIAGTMRLARHLPPTTAWEMALTGEPIDAREAHRIHLVNRIVEPEDLLPEARRVALAIARHPPLAVRTEMEALRRGDELDADDAYAFGMTLYRQQRLAIGEGDVQETFLYKR